MKHQNVVERVMVFIITRNLDELSQLTKYKIAEIFHINKNYLLERFKSEVNMTVFAFINFEKMKRAEKLLTTRFDLPVEVISRKVGIAKCNQFRRKFRKIYGLNPGKYRKLFKDKQAEV